MIVVKVAVEVAERESLGERSGPSCSCAARRETGSSRPCRSPVEVEVAGEEQHERDVVGVAVVFARRSASCREFEIHVPRQRRQTAELLTKQEAW